MASPICTPSVLRGSYAPWVSETPTPSQTASHTPSFNLELEEPSPRHADVPPSQEAPAPPGAAAAGLVTQEFLRGVCAPYFEQMLQAVERAVQEQLRQGGQAFAAADARSPQPAMVAPRPQAGPLGLPIARKVLTPGGFLQPPIKEGQEGRAESREGLDGLALPTSPAPISIPITPQDMPSSPAPMSIPITPQDLTGSSRRSSLLSAGSGSGPTSGAEPPKSPMVCHHWKSKGWCKMEEKCKFQHPEHKRGVTIGAQKDSKGSRRNSRESPNSLTAPQAMSMQSPAGFSPAEMAACIGGQLMYCAYAQPPLM